MAAGPTPPASRLLSSWPPPAASKCVDGPLLPGAAKREVRRHPVCRVSAVAHQDLPRTPSAATSSPWLDLRARIAQDGPPSCSERPRTSALRWRDCTWSREHRRRQKYFLLQGLQRLRDAIKRELHPRAKSRSVLRLSLQSRDPRNEAVVRQWISQNIAAQAQRYSAVQQHANRYLIAQSDHYHSYRCLLNASPSPKRIPRFCPDGRAVSLRVDMPAPNKRAANCK